MLDNLKFQVQWTLGDISWEPMSSCKELEALDTYLELWGMANPYISFLIVMTEDKKHCLLVINN